MMGTLGRIGSHGLGNLGTAFLGASTDVASGGAAAYDFYGSGGYAYRAYVSGSSTVFIIIRGSGVGTTITPTSNPGAYAAVLAESRSYPHVAAYSITSGYAAGSTPSTLPTPAAGSSGKLPLGTQVTTGGQNWLNTFTSVTDALTPLVGAIVPAIQNAGPLGAGGSPAAIAGQIAAKQRQLASTTNPVKRAKLQAEIEQLQRQQAMYGQAVDQGLAETGGGPLVVQSGSPSWLVPTLLLGGLLVVGGGAYIMSQQKKRRS